MPGIEVRTLQRGWAGFQKFLDSGGEEFALVQNGGERAGEAGDDERGRVGAGDDDGLFVECGEDVVDEAFGHAWGVGVHSYVPTFVRMNRDSC
jgi:hypothetical protein